MDSKSDNLLSSEDVSVQFGISKATLASWRTKSFGPVFVRVGRAVRYRTSDIESWLNDQLVTVSS